MKHKIKITESELKVRADEKLEEQVKKELSEAKAKKSEYQKSIKEIIDKQKNA